MSWAPALGAVVSGSETRFQVWAPCARRVQVVGEGRVADLSPGVGGMFEGAFQGWPAGSHYRYLVDGAGPFPDPASRFQPEGVHGPSEVVDPAAFSWSDAEWRGVMPENLVFYELHVGTFTRQGTFAAVQERLPYLRELGITAIELLPLADFPGRRNWGYDGVSWFAPARCYGEPDDLRRLVDAAHAEGIAVVLDVVYNHFGPDGNYTGVYSPFYVSPSRRNLWGPVINYDGEHSRTVRQFVIENALHWLHEYHLDGFRLDATHAIEDSSGTPLLAELAARVRETVTDRRVHLYAEDHRNLDTMIRPPSAGGWGLDGIWSDDYHHEIRRFLTGEGGGVLQDFAGRLSDLALIIERGWLFRGEYSQYRRKPRGTDPAGLEPRQLVFFLQNHDRVANHGRGDRLPALVGLPATRAATALTLLLPYTPLLFMGQEWAASSPFLFFTDHEPALGRQVWEGRAREHRAYLPAEPDGGEPTVPDPQAWETFERCLLEWEELESQPGAGMYRLHQRLLQIRATEPALAGWNQAGRVRARAIGEHTIVWRCDRPPGQALLGAARLRDQGPVEIPAELAGEGQDWQLLMTTEDPAFVVDPAVPAVRDEAGSLLVDFKRPSALVWRRR